MNIFGFEISRARPPAGPAKPAAQYDVVSTDGETKRRRPKIERTGEHGSASKQLPPKKNLEAINLAREAYRNTSGARIIEDQWTENAVGSCFKLSIQIFESSADGARVKPESVKAAEAFFNKRFARNCELKKETHLNDFFRCGFSSVFREGDFGLFFDADLLDTGRLVAFEADELAELSAEDLKKIQGADSQAGGVVFDAFGREIAYVVNRKGRGQPVVAFADAIIFNRDPERPEANNFKLVRRPWRFNQARGISRMMAPLADIHDAGEIKTNEVAAGKIASSLAVIVKPKGPAEEDEIPDGMNPGAPASSVNPDKDPAVEGSELVEYRQDYTEAFAGLGAKGIYADGDDDIDIPNVNRPNLNAATFIEWIQRSAGASVGLADCYSALKVNKSYTAFRGEMVLTWTSIIPAIKWFERDVKDWIGVRVLRWAMRGNIIPALPEGWEDALKWSNPKMPDVSLNEEQTGVTALMKNGGTSLEDQYGPDWESILEQQGRENKAAKLHGVALARNEMKSGGAAKADPSHNEETENA